MGMSNFFVMLNNFFNPLFEATLYPSKHEAVHRFLLTVRGFDTVDDESEYEAASVDELLTNPKNWDKDQNPPYAYYLYYLYANIQNLNILRKNLGLNTFQFRPHCGESGQIDHLVAAFLLCDGISHGIQLQSNPFVCYLYYLSQIGIAMSPQSNNKVLI